VLCDNATLTSRADVPSFDLLVDQGIEVAGVPRVELLHSSDNLHIDMFVRISEEDGNGVSSILCDVYSV